MRLVAVPPTPQGGPIRILDRAPTANPVPAVLVPPTQAAIFDPFGQPCSATPASVLFNGAPLASFTRSGNVLTLTGLTTSRTAAPRSIDSLNLHLTKSDGSDTDATNAPAISALTVNGLARGWTMDAAGAVTLTAWAHGPRTAAPRVVDSTHLQLTRADGSDTDAGNAPSLSLLTRTDWQGTVALSSAARTNVSPVSEDLTNGGWIKTRCTIGAATRTAPNVTGGVMRFIQEDATAANTHLVLGPGVTLADNTSYKCMAVLYPGTRTRASFRLRGKAGSEPGINIDLTAGTVAALSTATDTYAIRLSDGSLLCGFTAPSGTGATTPRLLCYLADAGGLTSYNGDGASGLYFWGAMASVEGGSYIATGATPVTLTDYTMTSAGAITTAQSGGTYSGTWSYTGGLEAGDVVAASWTYSGPLTAGDTVGVNW